MTHQAAAFSVPAVIKVHRLRHTSTTVPMKAPLCVGEAAVIVTLHADGGVTTEADPDEAFDTNRTKIFTFRFGDPEESTPENGRRRTEQPGWGRPKQPTSMAFSGETGRYLTVDGESHAGEYGSGSPSGRWRIVLDLGVYPPQVITSRVGMTAEETEFAPSMHSSERFLAVNQPPHRPWDDSDRDDTDRSRRKVMPAREMWTDFNASQQVGVLAATEGKTAYAALTHTADDGKGDKTITMVPIFTLGLELPCKDKTSLDEVFRTQGALTAVGASSDRVVAAVKSAQREDSGHTTALILKASWEVLARVHALEESKDKPDGKVCIYNDKYYIPCTDEAEAVATWTCTGSFKGCVRDAQDAESKYLGIRWRAKDTKLDVCHACMEHVQQARQQVTPVHLQSSSAVETIICSSDDDVWLVYETGAVELWSYRTLASIPTLDDGGEAAEPKVTWNVEDVTRTLGDPRHTRAQVIETGVLSASSDAGCAVFHYSAGKGDELMPHVTCVGADPQRESEKSVAGHDIVGHPKHMDANNKSHPKRDFLLTMFDDGSAIAYKIPVDQEDDDAALGPRLQKMAKSPTNSVDGADTVAISERPRDRATRVTACRATRGSSQDVSDGSDTIVMLGWSNGDVEIIGVSLRDRREKVAGTVTPTCKIPFPGCTIYRLSAEQTSPNHILIVTKNTQSKMLVATVQPFALMPTTKTLVPLFDRRHVGKLDHMCLQCVQENKANPLNACRQCRKLDVAAASESGNPTGWGAAALVDVADGSDRFVVPGNSVGNETPVLLRHPKPLKFEVDYPLCDAVLKWEEEESAPAGGADPKESGKAMKGVIQCTSLARYQRHSQLDGDNQNSLVGPGGLLRLCVQPKAPLENTSYDGEKGRIAVLSLKPLKTAKDVDINERLRRAEAKGVKAVLLTDVSASGFEAWALASSTDRYLSTRLFVARLTEHCDARTGSVQQWEARVQSTKTTVSGALELAPLGKPCRASVDHLAGIGLPVHHGYFCAESGMDPIVGTRYHKKSSDPGYNLCQAEFGLLAEDDKKLYTVMHRSTSKAVSWLGIKSEGDPDAEDKYTFSQLGDTLVSSHGWFATTIMKLPKETTEDGEPSLVFSTLRNAHGEAFSVPPPATSANAFCCRCLCRVWGHSLF